MYVGRRRALEVDQSLFEMLSKMQEVAVPLGLERLRTLTAPPHYLGAAPEMVDCVLANG